MVMNASRTRKVVDLNKTAYCLVAASALSGTMKHRRAASERESPGRCVQLPRYEKFLSLREDLPSLLEQL